MKCAVASSPDCTNASFSNTPVPLPLRLREALDDDFRTAARRVVEQPEIALLRSVAPVDENVNAEETLVLTPASGC